MSYFIEMASFKRFNVVFFLLISFILTLGISGQNIPIDQCATDGFIANKDYFPDKVSIGSATLFSVNYFNSYKIVTNKQSNEIFVLYQCGTPIPTGFPPGSKLFQISVKNVAVTDTSVIPFLDLLGFRPTIKLLDSSDLVTSPCVQSGVKSGTIGILTTNQTNNAIQLGGIDLTIGAPTANANDQKSVSIATASDPGVLNRAEWLKFYSTFFNAESKANDVYGNIQSNYECFKDLANKHSQSTKPTVAWVAFDAPSQYNNNIPSWKIADGIFKKQLTEDAGGIYFNATPLTYQTSTDFLKVIENVDILIDESLIGSNINDVLKNFGLTADQQQYKFIKNQAIYREDGTTNPNDGRDWFENAIVMSDAVLEDMINVINPKLPKSDYNRIWLRNVAKDEKPKISSADSCTNPNQSLTSKADNCKDIKVQSGSVPLTPNLLSCLVMLVFVKLAILSII